MKHIQNLIFLFSIIYSFQGFGQEHSFILEDVQEHKTFEGKFESTSAEKEDFRLIRVNNSKFSKGDLKRFNRLRKNYLTPFNIVKEQSNQVNELKIGKTQYVKVDENNKFVTYEAHQQNKLFVQQVELYYSYGSNQLEKAVLKQYNPHSNQQQDVYVVRFFSYR